MSDERDVYTPEEREALRHLGENLTPAPELEERIVGILRRRGLVETPEPARGGGRFRALLLGLAKPALAAAALAGAFLLGRLADRERPFHLVPVSTSDLPGGLVASDRERVADGVPRALFVTGGEDRRYDYYVDERGESYYVLVKLPMPHPLVPAPPDSERAHGDARLATAQSVPSIEDNRFEYFYDTHGNAYGVLVKDAPAYDLFATR